MRLDQAVRISLLLEKTYDSFVKRNRPIAETDKAFHPRRPPNIMKFCRQVNPDKEIIGEKRDDSFSFFCYSDEIEAREENFKTPHAKMKLCLFLPMWLSINHIPISRYV